MLEKTGMAALWAARMVPGPVHPFMPKKYTMGAMVCDS